jgi:hypothetical protein
VVEFMPLQPGHGAKSRGKESRTSIEPANISRHTRTLVFFENKLSEWPLLFHQSINIFEK